MSDDLKVGKDKVDPLTMTSGEPGKVLFDRMSKAAVDFPHEAVVNGAGNVLLNVLRQRNETRDKAEKDFNEMFGRLKSILMAHYDGATGRRRSVFPHNQVIHMPFVSLKDKH